MLSIGTSSYHMGDKWYKEAYMYLGDSKGLVN